MKIFAYRLQESYDKDIGFCGIVFAKTRVQLFWALDEFCNPYMCEIKELKDPSGICFAFNFDSDEIERDRLEVGYGMLDVIMDDERDGWRPAFEPEYDVTKAGVEKL